MINKENSSFMMQYGNADHLDKIINDEIYPERHFFGSHPSVDIVRNPNFNQKHLEKLIHGNMNIQALEHVLEKRKDLEIPEEYQKQIIDHAQYPVKWAIAQHTSNPGVMMHIAKTARPGVHHAFLMNANLSDEHVLAMAERHGSYDNHADHYDSRSTYYKLIHQPRISEAALLAYKKKIETTRGPE